jgi:hypothetical protein
MMIDDPPEEKKGSGIPVAGTSPETTATFSSAWNRIQVVIPIAQ